MESKVDKSLEQSWWLTHHSNQIEKVEKPFVLSLIWQSQLVKEKGETNK